MENAIKEIYKHRQDFIIIGLTGRIGSGCSTVAKIMQNNVSDFGIEQVSIAQNTTDELRKKHIIVKFFQKNWKPFYIIRASDIILSFILEHDLSVFDAYIKKCGVNIDITIIENKFHEMNIKTIQILEKLNNKINIEDIEDLDELHNYLAALNQFNTEVRTILSTNSYRDFTKVFQSIGDNIRRYGEYNNDIDDGETKNIYNISSRINQIIKAYSKYKKNENESAYFVIDAFRNPFEVMFFRERYSAFYLMSVNCSDEDRKDRLLHSEIRMSIPDIEKQDEKENPDDLVKDLKSFVSQNISACIEKSDLHIHNPGEHDNFDHNEVKGQIIKYISLIQHPGLITPSRDEKLMQIAHTAKLNSGCISRQVGAVVTNKQQSLRAIGWNSVPDGQVPCLLRNSDNLIHSHDIMAYSKYEKTNIEFKERMKNMKFKPNVELGLNNPFCFKDVKNTVDLPASLRDHPSIKKMNNQVYTRSLHAEENAFLQIAKYGGDALEGGTLYSTASPCELCSKKAFQLGIKTIVYIDPYPGIAREQILEFGDNPPIVKLFAGAIGLAYHKLYDPILSFKDELKALTP